MGIMSKSCDVRAEASFVTLEPSDYTTTAFAFVCVVVVMYDPAGIFMFLDGHDDDSHGILTYEERDDEWCCLLGQWLFIEMSNKVCERPGVLCIRCQIHLVYTYTSSYLF